VGVAFAFGGDQPLAMAPATTDAGLAGPAEVPEGGRLHAMPAAPAMGRRDLSSNRDLPARDAGNAGLSKAGRSSAGEGDLLEELRAFPVILVVAIVRRGASGSGVPGEQLRRSSENNALWPGASGDDS